ncbi:RNase H [bacterium DOLJORAL78_65_58]|nr:MAG: RNase H [bacterium DOLZORAL124_64_63]PIE75956.1 MAG: RNase H [bacterium DOLJORAL78_65_58]
MVSENRNPKTLTDLLRALERSGDLRSLARECGLSVRELRRRLAIWRRELAQEAEQPGTAAARATVADTWPQLPSAAHLKGNPLPKDGSRIMEIFTDGASRGNPGPAAIGIVFRQRNGPNLAEHSEAIGRATNNVAEYQAVVTALEHARRWKVKKVHLFLDSELITRQLTGVYRVKSPDLRPLFQQVVFLSRGLTEFQVRHVKRRQNAHADALANKALDADS